MGDMKREDAMGKTAATETAKQSRRQRGEAKPAVNGAAEPEAKPKRRRMRKPSGFVGELRELAEKYRARLAKIMGPEQDLIRRLEGLKAQRAEAETMLIKVEEMLASTPELPGIEPAADVAVTEIAQLDEARNDGVQSEVTPGG